MSGLSEDKYVTDNLCEDSKWEISRYRRLLTEHKLFRYWLPLVTLIFVTIALYMSFIVAPDEQVMGPVQRIFYFHVASATTVYSMIGVLFVGSICYLATRRREWDLLAGAAESVAFLLCGIVLLTGMIWGHSAWNVWWSWEPRLVSSLVLWLVLLGGVILRKFSANESRAANFSAVMGIIAAVNVPLVMFAIRLFPGLQQLHPQVVANQGLRDQRYIITLLVAIVAVHLLAVTLLVVRLANAVIRNELEQLLRGRDGN